MKFTEHDMAQEHEVGRSNGATEERKRIKAAIQGRWGSLWVFRDELFKIIDDN